MPGLSSAEEGDGIIIEMSISIQQLGNENGFSCCGAITGNGCTAVPEQLKSTILNMQNGKSERSQ